VVLEGHIAHEVRTIFGSHNLPATDITLAAGFANLVVLTPTHVLRLNDGRFPGAFGHEARVLSQLPDTIPHPVVAAHGEREQGGEYLVLERLPGTNLQDAWTDLDPEEQYRIGAGLGDIVRRIHALPVSDWMHNPWVEDVLVSRRWRDAYHAPPEVATELIESAGSMRPETHSLLARIGAFIAERSPAFASNPTAFIHTDLHFRNVVVADGRISGLIDFEGSRLGPADVELDMLSRTFQSGDEAARLSYINAMSGFRSAYPAIFETPNLVARLEVYEALWHLVQLHHWQPGHRWTTDPADSLELLLQGSFTAHLHQFLY
jgi:aminoglycoside 2''-phosphotransferase